MFQTRKRHDGHYDVLLGDVVRGMIMDVQLRVAERVDPEKRYQAIQYNVSASGQVASGGPTLGSRSTVEEARRLFKE